MFVFLSVKHRAKKKRRRAYEIFFRFFKKLKEKFELVLYASIVNWQNFEF